MVRSIEQPANKDVVSTLVTDRNIPAVVIQPTRGWSSLGLRDLWEYRELLYFSIWRELQGRYRQTALGLSWLLLRPIVNMLVLSAVFGGLVKVPTGDIPYPLFSLSALLPWGFFSSAVGRAAGSLVENMHIISKIYFPRMIIPLAGVISGLVDFLASFVILLIMLAIYHMPLRVEILWLPLFMVIVVAFGLAVGLWLATLSVKYRDVLFALNFMLQALMYASPVVYPVSLVPASLRSIYMLNPMTGVIQGFRWALFGGVEWAPDWLFAVTVVGTLLALVSGAYVFRRTERSIVDVL